MWALVLFAYASSMSDLRSAECRVACRYSGHDSGDYQDSQCRCIDYLPYEQMMGNKKLTLPHRVILKRQKESKEE